MASEELNIDISNYNHINDVINENGKYVIHAYDSNFEWDWFITVALVDDNILHNICWLIDTAFSLWYIDDLGLTPTEVMEELLSRYNYDFSIETRSEE